MWGWGWMHGYGGLPFWWLGMGIRGVFIAAIVVGIVFVARYFGGQGWRGHVDETALEILQKRYARGEISKEEYEEMKRNLT